MKQSELDAAIRRQLPIVAASAGSCSVCDRHFRAGERVWCSVRTGEQLCLEECSAQ